MDIVFKALPAESSFRQRTTKQSSFKIQTPNIPETHKSKGIHQEFTCQVPQGYQVTHLSVTCRLSIPHPGPEYPIQLSASYTTDQVQSHSKRFRLKH